MEAPQRPRVGLFVTCLVDLFRPSIGWAAVKLLEDAGCTRRSSGQTCCGQPAYNSGDRRLAKELARPVIEASRLTIMSSRLPAPAPACSPNIIRRFSPTIPISPAEANRFAAKVYELSTFLHHVSNVAASMPNFRRRVTYHDSCSGLRELGIAAQPRKLLGSVRGLELVEMEGSDTLLRLRRHVRGQIRRNLRRHRRGKGREHPRPAAHRSCSPAISAAS